MQHSNVEMNSSWNILKLNLLSMSLSNLKTTWQVPCSPMRRCISCSLWGLGLWTAKQITNTCTSPRILCPFCEETDASQRHMLDCTVLNKHIKNNEASEDKVVYENLFKDRRKQKEITALFMMLLDIRYKLMDEYQLSQLNPGTSVFFVKFFFAENHFLGCLKQFQQ